MNKYVLAVALVFMMASCNDSAKTEADEQKQRDSMDAVQRFKDSMDVEAKILRDMEADTQKATDKPAEVPVEDKK